MLVVISGQGNKGVNKLEFVDLRLLCMLRPAFISKICPVLSPHPFPLCHATRYVTEKGPELDYNKMHNFSVSNRTVVSLRIQGLSWNRAQVSDNNTTQKWKQYNRILPMRRKVESFVLPLPSPILPYPTLVKQLLQFI